MHVQINPKDLVMLMRSLEDNEEIPEKAKEKLLESLCFELRMQVRPYRLKTLGVNPNACR